MSGPRYHHAVARFPVRTLEMDAFANFVDAMGIPWPMPTQDGRGRYGPPVSFYWQSDVPIDLEAEEVGFSQPAPRQWSVGMEFRADGSIEVRIATRNADDLLFRLVGYCTLNGIPYRVVESSKGESAPETKDGGA